MTNDEQPTKQKQPETNHNDDDDEKSENTRSAICGALYEVLFCFVSGRTPNMRSGWLSTMERRRWWW